MAKILALLNDTFSCFRESSSLLPNGASKKDLKEHTKRSTMIIFIVINIFESIATNPNAISYRINNCAYQMTILLLMQLDIIELA